MRLLKAHPSSSLSTAFDGTSGRMLSESGRPQMSLGIVGSGQINDDLSRLVTGKREGSRILAFRTITMGDGSPNAIGDRCRRHSAFNRHRYVGRCHRRSHEASEMEPRKGAAH